MQVERLPMGKQAPMDKDCLRIEQQANGSYRLTASALCAKEDDPASVSMSDERTFANADEAESAGLAWADDVGVERVYISVGTLDHPLERLEIDQPL